MPPLPTLVKFTLSVDTYHWILPVEPAKVNAAGAVPEVIVWLAEAVPEANTGLTVVAVLTVCPAAWV